MKKGTIVYALLVLGIGENEDAYELVGIFSTEQRAKEYYIEAFDEPDDDYRPEYNIEPRMVDDPENDPCRDDEEE